jgi:hypothetical protein
MEENRPPPYLACSAGFSTRRHFQWLYRLPAWLELLLLLLAPEAPVELVLALALIFS